jgi:sigma-B regulation protein RsbU (phosphoserine phosphatase)
MFNKSIAYRLSIYISLAVIGVFLAFIAIAFYFNSGILKNNILNKATALGSQVLMIAEKQLVSTREITSNISEQAIYFVQNDDVPFLIEKVLTKYPYLNAIHINIDSVVPDINYHNYYFFKGEDSIFIDKGNELIYHCEHEKHIFEERLEIGVPGWTESFTCKKNGKYVVSYIAPIQVQGNNEQFITVGTIITELSLLELNDSIKNLKISEKGQFAYAAIVSRDGTYLTHPNEDYILNRNLYMLPDQISTMDSLSVYHLLNDGKPGVTIAYPDYLNYEKCWVYFMPIKETEWTLLFAVPYNQLFESLYLLVLKMLFFSVLGILVIFFIVTYISNKLIEPLSTVTSQLKKFSSLTGELGINTNNEIKQVSDSLNYLQEWYEKFKINQQLEEQINTQRKQDLLEASEIQMSLINTDFSIFKSRENIDLFAIYKPARIVSGDLFDFIFLDKDNLFFTIGDVSGKGVSAAFFMSVAQTLLKSNSRLKEPGKIAHETNNKLYTVNQHQFFLTLFCGVVNIKSGVLKYTNAAHTSALLLKTDGQVSELVHAHGMPLGLYPNKKFEESEVQLEPGDSIILYTDGVTELQNSNKEHFGIDRFTKLLQQSFSLSPRKMIGEVEKNMENFKDGVNQTDDITILALQFKGKKKA